MPRYFPIGIKPEAEWRRGVVCDGNRATRHPPSTSRQMTAFIGDLPRLSPNRRGEPNLPPASRKAVSAPQHPREEGRGVLVILGSLRAPLRIAEEENENKLTS